MREAIMDVPVGESFKRLYPHKFSSRAFNPNTGVSSGDASKGGRFHPFVDASGNNVPTMYIADHVNAAFAETILRNDSVSGLVSINDIELYSVATLRFTRKIRALNLSHSLLNHRYSKLLCAEREKSYVKLRTLAASLHSLYGELDGLRWDGKQLGMPGMTCFVLFGDRIKESAIEVIQETSLRKGQGLEDLRKAAVALDFTLPKKYLISL